MDTGRRALRHIHHPDTTTTTGTKAQKTATAIPTGLPRLYLCRRTQWSNSRAWKKRLFSERNFLGSIILRYVDYFAFGSLDLHCCALYILTYCIQLERFLIANRDEYLQHSNMNYTAEQKQYNNWLTEQLLELAGQHNYVFDPEDFNFVAIRDRIRCYYKSYVQTARKRGLKLPEKKKE